MTDAASDHQGAIELLDFSSGLSVLRESMSKTQKHVHKPDVTSVQGLKWQQTTSSDFSSKSAVQQLKTFRGTEC